MSQNELLAIKDLYAGYDRSAILQGVNMVVGKGEIVAVLGRNGMGKTTLLRSIMGLLPTMGRLSFESENIGDLPSHIRAQKGIGYVPQGRGLFRTMSVRDNLATGLEIGRLKRGQGENDESFLHELFPILRERSSQLAGTMSGGEQQQVAIGRALIGKPALLILDEPSEGIQPSIVNYMARALLRLNLERGQAVMIVEQNIEMVCAMASRCYVMENGRIVHEVVVDKSDPAALHGLLAL